MLYHYPQSFRDLVEQLMKLPGIGPKTAQRLGFFLLSAPDSVALGLAQSIEKARRKIRRCSICGNLSEDALCPVCADGHRDRSVICVVEQPKDVILFENTREYHGLYHVLHGAISPMEGIGPDQLTIPLLLKRIQEEPIQEVVMATNPNLEGDATAFYLAKQLKPLGIKVSRIAHGVPVGGDLEFADEATISRAFLGRKEL